MIYIFHTRACINGNEEVYKLGKTKVGVMKRLQGYDKGTTIEFLYPVPMEYVDDAETFMLRHLRQTFEPRKDYGKEYFEADKAKMVSFVSRMLDSFIERQQQQQQKKQQKPTTPSSTLSTKPWRELCGQTFRTEADAQHHLYHAVFPALNRSFKVVVGSGLCVENEKGPGLSLDAMVSMHRNRWLAWGPNLRRGGRTEVVRAWASWPGRREE